MSDNKTKEKCQSPHSPCGSTPRLASLPSYFLRKPKRLALARESWICLNVIYDSIIDYEHPSGQSGKHSRLRYGLLSSLTQDSFHLANIVLKSLTIIVKIVRSFKLSKD